MSQQPLNLVNIQGDILSGLPKKTQTYFFFQITDVTLFRSQLVNFVPLVKTVAQVMEDRQSIADHKKKGYKTLLPMAGVNISFSHKGLKAMGIEDSNLTASEPNFLNGQANDSLGDDLTAWEPEFLQEIHAVVLVSGDSHDSVNRKLGEVKATFGLVKGGKPSVKEVISIVGDVRPGEDEKHEHFGFLDGISNPSVIGFDEPLPGPPQVRPGILVTGHEGDPVLEQGGEREEWAKDGSFLTFRYLFQNVPEFNKFLRDNPVPGFTPEEGSELLGARMVGRWKSGAPIDITPLKDDPELAKDRLRNNNFRFEGQRNSQTRCPFAAHVRKTLPRADLNDQFENRRIARRGVQFGPEVTQLEHQTNKTLHARGLLFACYSTSINAGFAFIQQSWANNPNFIFGTTVTPGLDPLIGQGDRKMSGTDPNKPEAELSLPDFIIARGGEYFFSPSLKGLTEKFAAAA